MDYNRGSKFQSIISVESRKSSFCRSLGRPSLQRVDANLDNKVSLIYAMSIQSENRKSEKSDIFQRLLQSDKKPKYRTSNINQQYNKNQIQYQNYGSGLQRNSERGQNNQDQIFIDHECRCYLDCYRQQCPCLQAKNQMCIKGPCCNICVQLKTLLFRGNNFVTLENREIYQNNMYQENQQMSQFFLCNCKNTQCLKSYCKCFQKGQFCSQKCGCQACKNRTQSQQRKLALQAIKSNGEVTFCTCKKTKCNKKYCSCYASGLKCGKHCSCQNCTNCVKNNDMDIEVYQGEQEQDYIKLEMPQRMSFEKVVFE